LLDGRRILLIQRKRDPEAGCWGIPGGKIDLYETAEQAARRELREETGIEAGALGLLCIADQIDPAAGLHWISPIYLGRSWHGSPVLREPAKHGGLAWFDLDRLPEALTSPTRAAVAALRALPPSAES
jgi:ADP-ribose pyrophosphatase YjhB (NUDIX family)